MVKKQEVIDYLNSVLNLDMTSSSSRVCDAFETVLYELENVEDVQERRDKKFVKSICVDFDGVIHWYRKGWQDGRIYDDPVPGAIEWLIEMIAEKDIEINIYSSRSKDKALHFKMVNWIGHQLSAHFNWDYDRASLYFSALKFPTQKPAAWLTIDDQAICFKGSFPTLQEINNFKPWTKD